MFHFQIHVVQLVEIRIKSQKNNKKDQKIIIL